MGYPEEYQDIPSSLKYMVEEEITTAIPLLLPKATYITCDYNKEKNCIITPDEPLKINGKTIQNHLNKCTKVTLITCTIGSTIDPYIDSYFKTGEFTKALILDAIGSTAVEYVADTMNQYVHTAAHRQQHSLISRFSPGYGDWDLTVQKELVNAAGGQAIGIQVTSSSSLIPRKSVSAIIGWIPGLKNQQNSYTSPCDLCQMPRCTNPICKGGRIV